MVAPGRIRNDRFNTEWTFAKTCWDALAEGNTSLEIPLYSMYQVDENTGKEKLVGRRPITPMRVTRNGLTVF